MTDGSDLQWAYEKLKKVSQGVEAPPPKDHGDLMDFARAILNKVDAELDAIEGK